MLTGNQPFPAHAAVRRLALKASHLTSPPPGNERTLLVGLERPDDSKWDHAESLQELGELVKSAGGEVVDTAIQRRPAPTAAFYIGPGKANELAEICKKENVGTVIFNDELSPAQSRNLEKVFERKILDRTQLILDIFAQRAKSKDGKLQIELAQLQYLLPRLTGMWTHLSRQSGGIGMRGPGETQLEVDRRRVTGKDRAADPGAGRSAAAARHAARRAGCGSTGRSCSLVGYTNAGKSTLLNRMTARGGLRGGQTFRDAGPDDAPIHFAEQAEDAADRHGRISQGVAAPSDRVVQGDAGGSGGGRSASARGRPEPPALRAADGGGAGRAGGAERVGQADDRRLQQDRPRDESGADRAVLHHHPRQRGDFRRDGRGHGRSFSRRWSTR